MTTRPNARLGAAAPAEGSMNETSPVRLWQADRAWLSLAIDLSAQCPPSRTAFSVGAVIVDGHGAEISRGFSRERPHVHAEESALEKSAADDERMATATLYSSLEPCTRRKSGPRACADLIIAAGIKRVVIAWREPPIFVPDAHGVEALKAAGVRIVECPELAEAAAKVNAALLTGERY
jgi:diaminohydroxyphosphoribosylaminopyrimidine deaminase / 5-amino-6-(5-phosphoribosylamino)uracil reductase